MDVARDDRAGLGDPRSEAAIRSPSRVDPGIAVVRGLDTNWPSSWPSRSIAGIIGPT
jgi:hypothetical protein